MVSGLEFDVKKDVNTNTTPEWWSLVIRLNMKFLQIKCIHMNYLYYGHSPLFRCFLQAKVCARS